MEFKDMQIMDKIKYVNSTLSTENLTDICKDLKISKVTMRKIFGEEKYFYDKHERQYLYEPGGDAERQAPVIELSELEYINKRIDRLEQDIKAMQGMAVSGPSKDVNILDDELTGELKVKSFKVYTEILNRFIDFSANYKSIKKQDLVSQALLEFIKNHE